MTFYGFARGLVGIFLRIFWRLRIIGAERVPRTGPLIVACNHVSYLDPPALGCAAPRPIYYMAKEELFRIPLLGPVVRALHAFPVDRSRGDVAAIRRAVEVLRTGAAVGIFPEGTRNFDGTVRPQPGIALLHYLSKAPVIPAYVAGTARAKRLAQISVVFGEPMQFATQEKASREDLAKWTDEIMRAVFALRETLGAD